MTRPDYCPVAQEPCQAMCVLSDVRCKIRDTPPAAQPAPVPLTKEQVRDLCKSAGYGMTSMQARADFINGIRHAEAAHGIAAAPQKGQ